MELIIVPAITGIIEAFKKIGMDVKFAPVVAVILGGISGVLFLEGEMALRVVEGILFGLASVGLYSGTKNTFEK